MAAILLFGIMGGPCRSLAAEAPDPPEKVSQARAVFNRAVTEYTIGKPDRAQFHWQVTRDLAPDWANRQPEFHKLRGLLLLGEEQEDAAMQAFTLSLALRPDPFLHYLQGNYYLKFRNVREARTAYTGAAAAFFGKQNPRKVALPSPEFTLAAYLPLACPGEDPRQPQGWLTRGLRNPFAATEWFKVHWERTLTKEELVLSLLQAMLLTRSLDGETLAVSQYRDWLSSIQISEDEITFGPTLSLMRAPMSDENHLRCLHGLEAMKLKQERIIAGGSSEPAARHLRTIEEYLRRSHWNRIAVRGDVSAYYSYGSYLIREGRAVEALHHFRRALRLTEYRIAPGVDPARINQAAQTMRQIEFAYARMGKEHDALTTGAFAFALEELTGRLRDGPAVSAAGLATTRAVFAEKAGENLRNREGLVFLLDHPGAAKGGETPVSLAERLRKRDERADEEELLSAYGYLYD